MLGGAPLPGLEGEEPGAENEEERGGRTITGSSVLSAKGDATRWR